MTMPAYIWESHKISEGVISSGVPQIFQDKKSDSSIDIGNYPIRWSGYNAPLGTHVAEDKDWENCRIARQQSKCPDQVRLKPH